MLLKYGSCYEKKEILVFQTLQEKSSRNKSKASNVELKTLHRTTFQPFFPVMFPKQIVGKAYPNCYKILCCWLALHVYQEQKKHSFNSKALFMKHFEHFGNIASNIITEDHRYRQQHYHEQPHQLALLSRTTASCFKARLILKVACSFMLVKT